MNVGDEQAPEAAGSKVVEGLVDGVERVLAVHAAVEQVRLVPVHEEKDVDQPVLERDREAKLEDALRDFGQREISGHPGILQQATNMSFGESPNPSGGNDVRHPDDTRPDRRSHAQLLDP
jgi:hypothetical protein